MKWLCRIRDALNNQWTQVVLWAYCLVTFTIGHFEDDGAMLWNGLMVTWAGALVVVALLKIRKRRELLIDDAIRRLSSNERELFPHEIQQPRPSQVRK
ncbi:hypothetical protein LCGC14_0772050 [marine sediment metagenome]|uniref:Uncharacterized protein n=1 Tax=marine sediment metagenome TaxID=412755 RepID=A0A0F9QHS4_9ZZZZ